MIKSPQLSPKYSQSIFQTIFLTNLPQSIVFSSNLSIYTYFMILISYLLTAYLLLDIFSFIFFFVCFQVGSCSSDLIKTEVGDPLMHLGGNPRLMGRQHNNNNHSSPQHANENGRLDGTSLCFYFKCSFLYTK